MQDINFIQTEEQVLNLIIKEISRICSIPQSLISRGTHLYNDFSLDSKQLVFVLVSLESKFNITIDFKFLQNPPTVNDILFLVLSNTKMKHIIKQHISIIIIALNEEKYLPVLLESLQHQTNQDFEIIVVDSNSRDNTGKVVLSYKKHFRSLNYLKLHCAKGPAYARNQGADVAEYERLLFLDADTRLHPKFIERISSSFLQKETDVATCPIRIEEKSISSVIGATVLNAFMFLLKPVYTSAYGACLISTATVHEKINGFMENLAVCEDCNYVKRARRDFKFKFRIISPMVYTSDRRAKKEGSYTLMWKYIKIHMYRMFARGEIIVGSIEYKYNN